MQQNAGKCRTEVSQSVGVIEISELFVILLTFFYRYMKELITEGHVYIGMPPLYKVVPAKALELNLAAFRAGLAAAEKQE